MEQPIESSNPSEKVFREWMADVLSIDHDGASGGSAAGAFDDENGGEKKSNARLQQEARSHFRQQQQQQQQQRSTSASSSSSSSRQHEEDLARLVRDLGPAVTSKRLPTRLRGLHVLLGSLEGCRDKPTSNRSLSLLGNFAALQCGPISATDDEQEDYDYEEDYEGLIRDVSVRCLGALVETPAAVVPETRKTDDDADGSSFSNEEEERAKAPVLRAELATRGFERRCATDDDDTAMSVDDDHYHGYRPREDIRGGLSTMPRSKRSMCFSLLRSAVVGISKTRDSAPSSLTTATTTTSSIGSGIIRERLVRFAEFTARCIHGESDPRCLRQLLELLHAAQVAFCPWFGEDAAASSVGVFPNEDFFDAVAPYYPIRFTPPPNNVHGITREGLHAALLSVLTFTRMDGGARKHRKPTMLGCSIGLFLEPLLPGRQQAEDDDEAPGVLEKIECVECVSNLLFPVVVDDDGGGGGGASIRSECANLSFDEVRNLSTALIATHDEASVGVTHEGGDRSDRNKVLAEACRRLSSRVAGDLETRASTTTTRRSWELFVSEPLDRELKKLEATPAFARTSIAYGASLATAGGPRTLRTCLAKGLRPLLEYLRERRRYRQPPTSSDDPPGEDNDDDDDAIAAVGGIAAFFSSAEVALSRSRSQGVKLTPHPLLPYTKDAFDLLLLEVAGKSDDEKEVPPPPSSSGSSLSLEMAAVSCLECLLLSSVDDADLFGSEEEEDLDERIREFLARLLNTAIVGGRPVRVDEGPGDPDELNRYRGIASDVLGRIIGASWTTERDDDDDDDDDQNSIVAKPKTVLSARRIRDFVRTEVFPKLEAAALVGAAADDDDEKKKKNNHGDRFDRVALSTACSSSSSLASAVVGSHLRALLDSLKKEDGNDGTTTTTTRTCLDALSFLIRSCSGDDNAIRAFHESDVVDGIIDALCDDLVDGASSGLRNSIAQIALPAATGDEQEPMESKIGRVNAIGEALLPAYGNRLVPKARLRKLAKSISDKIPPLSQADESVLIVRLPLLSAALEAAEPDLLREVVTSELLRHRDGDGFPAAGTAAAAADDLLEGLTDYVLEGDGNKRSSGARTAGASCVHALIKSGFDRNLDCPARPLLGGIARRVRAAAAASSSSSDLGATKNCFGYLSLLASAAALRGGSSSKTADGISRFLMEVACEGRAQLPFGDPKKDEKKIDFSGVFTKDDDYHVRRTALEVASASSYGAVLMEDGLKPLMKQRLVHTCFRYVKKLFGRFTETQSPGFPQVGLIVVVCHLVCASDLSKLDDGTVRSLGAYLITGFSTDAFRPPSQEQQRTGASSKTTTTTTPADAAEARKLVVCALLKFIYTAPAAVDRFVPEMVSGLLRSYAISDPETDVGCKLITLQALEAVTHLEGAKDVISSVKPAVIAILSSAMNQKDVLLRSATVDVRNMWCFVA